MKQMIRYRTVPKTVFLLAVFFLPTALYAQAGDGKPESQAGGPNARTPFEINSKSQFHCSEVDEPVIGSLATHEITVDPNRVSRCLLKKVGSRLNECKKLHIESATSDWDGIVTLDTEEGPIRFSFQQLGSAADGSPRMVLIWTWPDSEKKYLCTAFSSKR